MQAQELVNTQPFPARDAVVQFLFTPHTFLQTLIHDINKAQRRVWAQISFIQPQFRVPGQDQYFLEYLESVAARGVDVRLLFWDNTFTGSGSGSVNPNVFRSTPENKARLANSCPHLKIRWDTSPTTVHCHHVKAFIVDDISYVGGIVLTSDAVKTCLEFGYASDNKTRDLEKFVTVGWKYDNFLRVCGPTLADHFALFSLRWNGVAKKESCSWPSFDVACDLKFQDLQGDFSVSGENIAGIKCSAQMLCNFMSGLYPALTFTAPLATHPLNLSEGSESVLACYIHHITTAKYSILIESTHMADLIVLQCLLVALERGVTVLYVIESKPLAVANLERNKYLDYLEGNGTEGRYTEVFRLCVQLAKHPLFSCATIATNGPRPQENLNGEVFGRGNNFRLSLHSKLSVFDGEYFIVGSANQVDISFHASADCGHTELNYGISGKEATTHVLGILLPFWLGPKWNSEMLRLNFHDMMSQCVVVAKDNMNLWKNSQPIVGHLVENDILYHLERRDEQFWMFDAWNVKSYDCT